MKIDEIMKEAAIKAAEFLEQRFQNYTTQEKRDMAIMYMCGYFDGKLNEEEE